VFIGRGRRTRRFALALLACLAVPTAVAGVASEPPTLTVDRAVVKAKWKEGWLVPGATVRFAGTVSEPSTLTAALRPLDGTAVTARLAAFDAPPGSFDETLPLPPRPLPGPYRLHIASLNPPPRPNPVDLVVTIPAPPEGVIDRALVGTTRNGPWLRYVGNTGPAVTGSHKVLWVRFRFLHPPTGHRVELIWKLRWRRVVGKIYKRYKNTIDTYAMSKQPLPTGVWLVVLKIDNRIAKRMNVRLH
jgi:hypothetical protein